MESHDFLTSIDIANFELPKPLDVKPEISDGFVKNPWTSVSTLEDFLFYCCPECPHKFRSSISFTNHAVKHHPKSKEKFGDAYLPEIDFNEDDDSFEGLDFSKDIKLEVECEPSDYQNDENLDLDSDHEAEQKLALKDPDSEFQCYLCGHLELGLQKIKEHIQDVHKCAPKKYGDRLPYSCIHCGAVFPTEKSLSNHVCTNLIEVDTKEGEPLTCGKCSTVCSSKKDLVQHMTVHHSNEKNFGCPQCDYKAKSQLLITKHVRRLHKKERKHTCNLCGKSFFEKWNLTDHIVAVHQKKKPYVCDKCGKAFSQKSGLSSHNTFQHPDPNKVYLVDLNLNLVGLNS